MTQTLTDNLNLSATDKDAALVTTVAPGVSINSPAGRIRGTLDYSLNGIVYTKSDQANQIQQSLLAQGNAELVSNRFYIDANASISQQATSVFGAQTTDTALGQQNRTQLATVNVAPYLRGQIRDWVSVELRGNASVSTTTGSAIGDSHSDGGSLRFDSLSSGKLHWWSSLSTETTHYGTGVSDYTTSSENVGLTYQPDVDFVVSLNGGPERYDYGANGNQSDFSYGASSTWAPSSRTKAVVDWEHHDYGDSHTISFEHRMARSSLRYSDIQSTTLSPPNGSTSGSGTYAQLYASLAPNFVGTPAELDAYIKSQLANGVLANAPTLTRQQQVTFAIEGIRTSLNATIGQGRTRLLFATPVAGDLAQSSNIVTRSATLSLMHRLTPLSNASLSLSEYQSRGDTEALSNTLRTINVNWSSQLWLRTSVSLGARHSIFEGAPSYRENALIGNLVQQF